MSDYVATMTIAASRKAAFVCMAITLSGTLSPCAAEEVITLPGVTYFGSAGAGSGDDVETHYVAGPGSFSLVGDDDGDFVLGQGIAQGNVQINPTPVVGVFARASAGESDDHSGVAGFSASFGIFYYFEVIGAPGNVPVDINSDGSALVSASGLGALDSDLYAQAVVSITSTAVDGSSLTSGDAEVVKEADSFGTSRPNPDSFIIEGDFLASTNQIYRVEMVVEVAGDVEADGLVGASASVDPQILIDPDFPNASEYSLVFSPGVGDRPIAGILEPSTWALLLLGFGGLGYTGCRRRSRSHSPLPG